jgi:type I restriction enzyme, R subunit
MANDKHSEDNNIQEPAARLFEKNLGWRSVYAFNAEDFGPDSLLGRKDASEVALVRELDKALIKLNPTLAAADTGRNQLQQARDQLLENAISARVLKTRGFWPYSIFYPKTKMPLPRMI